MNRQLIASVRQVVLMAFCVSAFSYTLSAQPNISATQDDNVPAGTRKNRGDTITNSVVITNAGPSGATGVTLNVPTPANTQPVVGSARVTPIAADESYTALGNTQLIIPASGGVLTNDFDPDNATPIVVKAGSVIRTGGTASPAGGLVINSDGGFTYTPGIGATGTDIFQYTITDAHGLDSVTPGIVTFTMAARAWYVKNNASNGDGRSHNPFNSLASASTSANAATDVIYVFSDGGGAKVNGNMILENGQQLLGQGVPLVIGGTQWFAAGATPELINSTGDTVTLGGNNVIAGLILGSRSGSAIRGSSFTALTLTNLVVSGTGQAFALNGGSVTATISSVGASGVAVGMGLTNLTGSMHITNGSLFSLSAEDISIHGGSATFSYGGTVNNGGGRSIVVQSRTANTVTFAGSIVDTAQGILIQNNTGGQIDFTHGTKTLNTAANTAVTLSANTGTTINFINGGLDIDTTTATGLNITGEGIVNISGANNLITTGSGTAVSANGGAGGLACNADLSGNGGRLIDVQNKTGGTVTFSGPLANAGTGASGIRVQNCNSGSARTIEFTSNSKVLNTGANAAVTLANNAGSTITFSGGGLNIDTTSGTGFSASGGATALNITGSGNVIDTTSGTGLTVTGTTIGSSGLTFEHISSSGGSASGIILDNTGANAGLTITGTGSAGSGGVIANKTGAANGSSTGGHGVYLKDCRAIVLNHLQINDVCNVGVYGLNVFNFGMTNCVINGSNGDSAGDALGDSDLSNDDACLSFKNLTGAAFIINSTISGGIEDNARVINNTGNLNRVLFQGVSFGLNGTTLGDNSLFIQSQGTAILRATVTNCTFSGARGDVFQFDATGSSTGDIIFASNGSTNTHSGIVAGGGGITISAGGIGMAPNLTYDLNANGLRGAKGDAILAALQFGSGTVTGRIRNNIIGTAGVDKSGSSEASCIEVRTVNATGSHAVTIDNNQVRQHSNYGIYVNAGEGGTAGTGSLHALVQNNTVSNPSTFAFSGFKRGVYVEVGIATGDAYNVCADILNNTTGGSGDGGGGGPDIRVRKTATFPSSTLRLPGYGGSATDTTAIATYLTGRNTGTETAQASAGSYLGGANCSTP